MAKGLAEGHWVDSMSAYLAGLIKEGERYVFRAGSVSGAKTRIEVWIPREVPKGRKKRKAK